MKEDNVTKIEKEINGKILRLETGRVAKRSSGSVVVHYGDTIVLVTAVVSPLVKEEMDFLPLVVDYQEKAYAVGKIPGGFFKREGKPSDEEILSSRLIDRSVRPLFPKGFQNEVQIIATVLSASESNQPPVLSIIGASVALCISGLPVQPIAGIRIGKIGDRFLTNPTDKELEKSQINLVVAGSEDGLIMVEGSANKAREKIVLEALQEAHSHIRSIIQMEKEFISRVGRKEIEFSVHQIEEELRKKVTECAWNEIEAIEEGWSEEEKESYLETVKEEVLEKLLPDYPEKERDILEVLDELKKKKVRELILQKGKRWDGRGIDEIRPISCEVAILPRTHGSALFTRGGTQALVVATLGTSADEQMIDGLQKEEIFKKFMFHYNFPPFSTGETRRLRAPGRREIGHGALAEKALIPVLPENDSFPYTIRLVSDILESNGSSSMASVCGGSLCLMDAGVPISEHVSGVGMGLVKEGDKAIILTDIQGLEDHLGDMDFKVAGTKEGITALQLDIKISGVSLKVLEEALIKARRARELILQKMEEVIRRPRPNISSYAPHIATLPIPMEKIGELIGPGGKVIKKIIKESGAKIEIDDMEGKVTVSSEDERGVRLALKMIKGIIEEPKVGQVYLAEVKKVTDFGAFVEIMPGKEGLVHISELSDKFVKNVSEVVKVGDKIRVKLIGIDALGRLNFSKKRAEQGGTINRS